MVADPRGLRASLGRNAPSAHEPFFFTNSRVCPVCGSQEIFYSDDVGEYVCARCGTVLDVIDEHALLHSYNVNYGKDDQLVMNHVPKPVFKRPGTSFIKRSSKVSSSSDYDVFVAEMMRHFDTIDAATGLGLSNDNYVKDIVVEATKTYLDFFTVPSGYVVKSRVAMFTVVSALKYSFVIPYEYVYGNFGINVPSYSEIKGSMALIKAGSRAKSRTTAEVIAKFLHALKAKLATKDNAVRHAGYALTVLSKYVVLNPRNRDRVDDPEEASRVHPMAVSVARNLLSHIPSQYIEGVEHRTGARLFELMYRVFVYPDKVLKYSLTLNEAVAVWRRKERLAKLLALLTKSAVSMARSGLASEAFYALAMLYYRTFYSTASMNKLSDVFKKIAVYQQKALKRIYDEHGPSVADSIIDAFDPEEAPFTVSYLMAVKDVLRRMREEDAENCRYLHDAARERRRKILRELIWNA